ncbi:MAG: hypothetical protein KAT05_03370 [Spirochaetes bacterium]|nr:hypothetical protein [Spirochaetota bacterium]
MTNLAKHLKINYEIDENDGIINTEFKYKDKICPAKEINGPIIDHYIGYVLILQDLYDVLNWMKLINKMHSIQGDIEDDDNDSEVVFKYELTSGEWKNNGKIIKSLYFSCIILYAKCFTQAEGRKIKLERDNIDPKFLNKHIQIMDYRNSFVAHSGESQWDKGKGYVVITPEDFKHEGIDVQLQPVLNRLDYEDDRKSKDSFFNLVESTIKYVEKKKKKIFDKIFKDIIKPKGADYWYS